MPLYVAQFVIVEEDIWFSEINYREVIRREEASRYVHCLVFAAPDSEAAYVWAAGNVDCMNDANCDGLGDQTRYTGLGLQQLSELSLDADDMLRELREDGSIEVAVVAGPPIIRPREELDLFKYVRLFD